MENGHITFARRDTREKITESINIDVVEYIKKLLETIQTDMYNRAVESRDKLTFTAHNLEELENIINSQPGFVHDDWCGDESCELRIKEIRGCKSRCIMENHEHIDNKCVVCGKDAKELVVWGIQY